MRDTDRKIISEAARTQTLWHIEDLGKSYHIFLTPYYEQLEVYYNSAGNVRFAEYVHWDTKPDGSRDTMIEHIRQNKRQRVLELLTQKDVNE